MGSPTNNIPRDILEKVKRPEVIPTVILWNFRIITDHRPPPHKRILGNRGAQTTLSRTSISPKALKRSEAAHPNLGSKDGLHGRTLQVAL